MPTYECDNCNYSTLIKTHYNKHLNTQKHLNNMDKLDDKLIQKLSNTKNEQISLTNTHNSLTNTHNSLTNMHNSLTNSGEQIFMCEYCNKSFNRKDNLKRHIKNYCENKKENDKLIIEIENKYKIELEIQKKETDFYK